jgi:hypothetical protein
MRILVVAVALLALFTPESRARTDENNRAVSFESVGAWEVWCIDIGGTGRVVCDLNVVVNYKPRPDFRAMIPRLFLDEKGAYSWRIDYERQTSFARGGIRTPEGGAFSLADCSRPCEILGDKAGQLVKLLAAAKSARIGFHDFLIQELDVEFPVEGFRDGIEMLRERQAKHRR